MADRPARKANPLNIIVNIINPLDMWHYPESWR